MTTQYITYISQQQIDCGATCPADVIICIPPALIAERECTEGSVDLCQFDFIEGEILSQCYTDVGCGITAWKVSLSYDDVQLVADTTLYSSQISGIICRDSCLAKWVQNLFDVLLEKIG